jgi:hypothetical protein
LAELAEVSERRNERAYGACLACGVVPEYCNVAGALGIAACRLARPATFVVNFDRVDGARPGRVLCVE